jgi:hypothetical protein
MSADRDMSEQQFRMAAKKSGFVPEAFGYWRLAPPCDHISVYRFNAGPRRRSQLAYLCAAQERSEAESEAKVASAVPALPAADLALAKSFADATHFDGESLEQEEPA